MYLSGQLATLESNGIIILAQLQPDVEYMFRHALIQQAAYNSLLKLDRRALHQSVGTLLERLYPENLTSLELTPILARHFAEAGDNPRALRYYTLAGRSAAEVFAIPEAIEHFNCALEIALAEATEAEAVTDLYLRRGRALELNAQDAEAIKNYEALQTWAEARGSGRAKLAALAARATIYVKRAVDMNLALGYDLSQQALALAQELGDRAAEAKVRWNLLQYYLSMAQNDEALANGEAALAIARELGLREQAAYVLTDLIKVYYQTDKVTEAMAGLDEARAIWRELGMHNMLADTLATTAMLHTVAGEYDQALALSEEALQISRAIGNLWNQSYALYFVDMVHFDRGDIGQAIATAEECLRLAAQAGFGEGIYQARFDLALIYAYMGAPARALQEAGVIQARTDSQSGVAHASPLIDALTALVHLLDGQLAEAEAVLGQARLSHDLTELKSQFYLTYFFIASVVAEVALARGDHQRALGLAEDVLVYVRHNMARLFLADTLLLKGRALRFAGLIQAAEDALQSARIEAEELGSRRILWQILAELAALEAARGNQLAAAAYQAQAAEIIGYIAEHAGSDALSKSFRRRAQAALVQ